MASQADGGIHKSDSSKQVRGFMGGRGSGFDEQVRKFMRSVASTNG